jgi:hypothetical protein
LLALTAADSAAHPTITAAAALAMSLFPLGRTWKKRCRGKSE